MSQKGAGRVKTPERFHVALFRSLFRGFRAFRIENFARNFALRGRLQNFVEFSHGLGGKRTLCVFEEAVLEAQGGRPCENRRTLSLLGAPVQIPFTRRLNHSRSNQTPSRPLNWTPFVGPRG